MNICLFEIEFF